MKHFDSIIIGDGIAAGALLWHLGVDGSHAKDRILQISSDSLVPACTLNSTSIVSLFGTRKGMTPLGDLLVDVNDYAQNFFEEYKPQGVYPSQHFHICDKGAEEKFRQRHGQETQLSLPHKESLDGVLRNCFLINPSALLTWLRDNNSLKTEKLNGLVVETSFNENKAIISILGGESFSATQVFVCAGAGMTQFFTNFAPVGKGVPGDYLVFSAHDAGEESWVITSQGHNLSYRAWSKELLLGSTTDSEQVLLADVANLKCIYNILKDIYPLPAIETATVFSGIRHKGKKRMPFWGEIEPGFYGLHSLYKNGFSAAFYGANELVKELKKA